MTVLKLHCEPLKDDWLDAYGHLNEAYYLVPFSNATWVLQDHFGIGVEYFDRTGGALYTVETHLRYIKDVRSPATMNIETMIIGADAKRIWFAHMMKVDGSLCATAEFMGLHYDSREKRVSAMPDPVRKALQGAAITDPPDWVGGQIGLRRQAPLTAK